VARREKVRSVNTYAHRQIAAEIENRLQLAELRPYRVSLPGCVFEKNAQVTQLQPAHSLAQSIGDRRNCVARMRSATRTGMRHQIIGAQSQRANDLAVKRLHGTRAQNAIGGSQIDQVIVVNDQRSKTKLPAPLAEPRRVRGRKSRAVAVARPHARTR
jgi:hypothetical protein